MSAPFAWRREEAPAAETLVGSLLRNAREHGGELAVRERELGIWHRRNWTEFADDVLAMAAGFEEIGVEPETAVTILGDNRYELYVAMLAAAALRAFPAPVFADVPPDELELFTRHGKPALAVAEDQEQVDKLLALRERTGRPRTILYQDPRGLAPYAREGLRSLDEVLARGRDRLAKEPGLADDIAGRAGTDDIAVLMHSSGTTGVPKGIAIRHRNLAAAAANAAAAGYFRTGDEHYAYLPMAWVGDYTWFAAGIILRFRINIPERQETVLSDLRAVAPTMYLAAPRAWDTMLTRVQVGIADSTPFKRRLFDYFLPRAVEMERARLAGETPTLGQRLTRAAGELLVFAPIKDYLGLSRTERAYTGGEALGEDTFLFFRALGVNLKQFYGQTETCALTAAQPDGAVKLHTVGHPLPGVEVKLDEDGQILVRSGSVVGAYFDDPVASAAAFVDGWLRTGDAGRLDPDGQLVVLAGVGELFRHGRIEAAPGMTFAGVDAVRGLYESATRLYADGTPRTRHVTTNVAVQVDETAGTATSHAYYTVFQQTEALSLQPIIAGHYHDSFHRVDDAWWFDTRVMFVDLTGDLSHHLLFDL